MLIDEFMPSYDVGEGHEIDVRASIETVYAAMNSIDLNESRIIRWLFRLRGLPSTKITLRDMKKIRFAVLGEVPNNELLFGLAGRFWTASGDMQRVNENNFRSFDKSGYAKATWNFSLERVNEETTRLRTETRVRCSDATSRAKFRLYWRMIRPFSAKIRREALRLIKRRAEESETEIYLNLMIQN